MLEFLNYRKKDDQPQNPSVAEQIKMLGESQRRDSLKKEFNSIYESHLQYLKGGGTNVLVFKISSDPIEFSKILKTHLGNKYSFVERNKKYIVFKEELNYKIFLDQEFEFSNIFIKIEKAALEGKHYVCFENLDDEVLLKDLLVKLGFEVSYSFAFPSLSELTVRL